MTGDKGKSGDKCNVVGQPNLVKSVRENINEDQTNSKLYTCDECDAGYNTVYDLLAHKGTHTGEYPYMCLYCHKGYKTKLNLSNHIKLHTREGLHTCDICSKIYTSAFLLKQHKRWHSDASPQVCRECGKTFKLIEMLRQHRRVVHSGTVLPCPNCKVMLASEHSLKMHLLKHKQAKNKSLLQCPRCPLKYASRVTLRNHINKHLFADGKKVKIFSCDMCGEKFTAKVRFTSHMRQRHTSVAKLPCIYCDQTYDNQDALDSHVAEHRQQPVGKCYICGGKLLQRHLHAMFIMNTKLNACRRCPLKFSTLPSLMNHMLTHDDDPQHYIFSCEVCGVQTFCRFQHEKHIRRHQPDTRSKVVTSYNCKSCSVSFITELELKEHVGTTHGNKDRMCEHCGMLFNNLNCFNRHRRGHIRKTQLPCLYCKRSFTSNLSLRLHMKVHLSRTFCCDICDAAFFTKHSYEAHKVSHANNGAHVCVKCHMTFVSEFLYFNHLAVHKTPPTCMGCDEQFSDIAALKKHAQTYHHSKELTICNHCNLGLLDKSELQNHSDKHIQEERELRKKAVKYGKANLAVVSVTSRRARVKSIGFNPSPSTTKDEPLVPIAMAYNPDASLPFYESYCTCNECKIKPTVIPDASFPVSVSSRVKETKLNNNNDLQVSTTVVQTEKPVKHIKNSTSPLPLPGLLQDAEHPTVSSTVPCLSSEQQKEHSLPQPTNLQPSSSQVSPIYFCVKCQEAFKLEILYFNHVEVHKTPPMCMECNEKFSDIVALKSHVKEYHYNRDLTICIRCNLGLLDKTKLQNHAYKHVEDDRKFRNAVKSGKANLSFSGISFHREKASSPSCIQSLASVSNENGVPVDSVHVPQTNGKAPESLLQCPPLSSSSTANDGMLLKALSGFHLLVQSSLEVTLLREQDESISHCLFPANNYAPDDTVKLPSLHTSFLTAESLISRKLTNSSKESGLITFRQIPSILSPNRNKLVSETKPQISYLPNAILNQNEHCYNTAIDISCSHTERVELAHFTSNKQLEHNFSCLLFGNKLNSPYCGSNLCAFLKDALNCMQVPSSAKSTDEAVLWFLQSILILYGGFSMGDFVNLGLNSRNVADCVADLLRCNPGAYIII